MATTRQITMHINKGKTLAQCLTDRTNYVKNPAKTDNGELVSSYACDMDMVDSQFLLSKKIYEQKTGRKQKNDIIAYQVRQAFKPGEITPELANKIGYELAEKITKGNHAFIVATHIDREHIHNHIVWNSTNLDCDKKHRDNLRSGKDIRKMSDLLCLQNGLSIVKNPKKKSKHYGQWLDDNNKKRPATLSDRIRESIDATLEKKPKDFEDFLSKMKAQGYEIKTGKHIAFKSKFQKKFIRLRSLGDHYSEEKIRDVINGKVEHMYKKKLDKKSKNNNLKSKNSFNMLIDIEAKISEGKAGGYTKWAKNFNLKEMAKTLNYLTENNLIHYEDLKEKADSISSEFSEISNGIDDIKKRMSEISTLQKHIFQFAKTKEVYNAYKKSGYSKDFREKNLEKILQHQATKNY